MMAFEFAPARGSPFNFLVLNFIVFPFQLLLFAVADFIWEDEASRCCEFTDGEDVQSFFR